MRNWCEGWVLGGVGGHSQNLTLISNWLEAHWAVFMLSLLSHVLSWIYYHFMCMIVPCFFCHVVLYSTSLFLALRLWGQHKEMWAVKTVRGGVGVRAKERLYCF